VKINNKLALCCAVFIAAFFICLSASADMLFGIAAVLSAIAAVICLAFSGMWKRNMRMTAALLLSAVFGIGFAISAKVTYYYPLMRFMEKYDGQECSLVLRIDKVDSMGEHYANYNCSVLICNGRRTERAFGRAPGIRLIYYGTVFADSGDVISLNGVPQYPERETRAGFEEATYLSARHIFVKCTSSSDVELIRDEEPGVVDAVRKRISDSFRKYIGDGTANDRTALAECMLLGDKSGISAEVKSIFRASGISHVLSVSGLHLSILFMMISGFLGLRGRSPRRRFVYAEAVSCIIVIVYMTLADFTPSIMRAGFMLMSTELYAAFIFYRRRLGVLSEEEAFRKKDLYRHDEGTSLGAPGFDGFSALFLAGTIICIVSPYSVFDVGMQLSFMSTLGILTAFSVMGSLEKRLRHFLLRVVFTSFTVTFAAVAFTLPICIHNFGTVSTVTAISNLAITPIMTPLLAVLLLLALLSFIPGGGLFAVICSFLGNLSELLCGLCIRIARFNASGWFSEIPVKENIFVILFFVAFVLFTVGALFFGKKEMKALGFCAIIMLYFSYVGVNLMQAVRDFSKPVTSFCTVKKRPYICVTTGNAKIIFDDTSGAASGSVIKEALGTQLYDTDNYYVVIPNSDADFESTLANIRMLDDAEGIRTVLIPTIDALNDCGANTAQYADFASELERMGYDIAVYSEEFTVNGITFGLDMSEKAQNVTFGEVCVIFSKEYNEQYAGNASKGSGYCIYFCDKVLQTDNLGYGSDAELYISSPLYKKVKGANQIPVRSPELLSQEK